MGFTKTKKGYPTLRRQMCHVKKSVESGGKTWGKKNQKVRKKRKKQ